MSLGHEATQIYPGNRTGDIKVAHYAISYTLHAITMPANDPLWMLLNGASLATATYPLLFALFGYTYGGSGANFNLPDLTEGRVPIGKGLTHFTSLAATGGEINHTLTSAEMASHSHPDTLAWSANAHGHTSSGSMSNTDDVHAHTMIGCYVSGDNTANIGTSPFTNSSVVGTTGYTSSGVTADHSHGGSWGLNNNASGLTKSGSVTSTVRDSGGSNITAGQAHNNMQPYVVVGGWLVKWG